MIKFFVCFGILAVITCVMYFVFESHSKAYESERDSHIPRLLTQYDVWLDGNTLKYRYEGDWYEAVARTKNEVLIYDMAHDKIVSVPFIVIGE